MLKTRIKPLYYTFIKYFWFLINSDDQYSLILTSTHIISDVINTFLYKTYVLFECVWIRVVCIEIS